MVSEELSDGKFCIILGIAQAFKEKTPESTFEECMGNAAKYYLSDCNKAVLKDGCLYVWTTSPNADKYILTEKQIEYYNKTIENYK